MAIRTKDEIMESMGTIFGEATDDTSIAFIEDISDTLDDFSARVADSTDWKEKYENNDREWRERYRARFFSGEEQPIEDHAEAEPISEEPIDEIVNFEDLFEEVSD